MLFWTLAVGFALLVVWIIRLNRVYYVLAFMAPRIKLQDGSSAEGIIPHLKGKTIFGNTFDTYGLDYVKTFQFMRKCGAAAKRSYVHYFASKTIINVIDADLAEMILTDGRLISKGFVYNFLKPALGEGLLVSSDQKWYSRRKMLTPAFHFNILGQFEDIFKEESQKFLKQLASMDGNVVALDEIIPKFTLNVVCESALGVKLDECDDGVQYHKSFHVIEECFNKRMFNPHLMIDAIYKAFEEKKYVGALKIIHEFSSGIIKKRRQLYADKCHKEALQKQQEFGYGKRRYAMLDTLLRAEEEGLINHAGICEEVDTFMFEGYDTTSMALTFALLNLSVYPAMQKRCYQEIVDHIEDMKTLSIQQLNELKYLECFIKETLRLYPTVPGMMRTVMEKTTLPNGVVLPARCHITIHLIDIQRNPLYFENPDVFDPERFTPENSIGRHPYAFMPFSAGQRNCIGQKFAMQEIKTFLVHVIKHFEILPLMDPSTIQFKTGIIIRSKDAIKVRVVKRQ